MDIDQMKNEMKKVKAPKMNSSNNGDSHGEFESLIARLKAAEAKEQKSLRQGQILFRYAMVFMGFLFILALFLPPNNWHPTKSIHLGVLLAAYLNFNFALRKRLARLTRVDYTQPLKAFLEDACSRYVFMTARDYAAMFIGLPILGVSGGIYVHDVLRPRYVDTNQTPLVMALYCLFYLCVCVLGFYFTRENWKRDKAPLLHEILKMRQSLADESV